ncbi:hypothetical protein [Paenibacillus tianjinensis]|uniref:Uncharacterized protein n=1 Tax=Paenibacillus tianjinensis TaxID=2810347 RepID=A0ABX7LH90_9BACL|nr:hypothetical protein [Paenibacillus tianjinensis]QSF46213.1 hypothetical protein JRJ22_06295 [Paenibacillus tianjinensis]
MALYEYAKFVKVLASNSGRGFQATVQLPSTKTMPSIGSYITAYVGLGPLEAGVSVQNDPKFKDSSGAYKWHWTVASETANETGGSGPMLQFSDGEIINLKVTIDDTVDSPTYKKMIFQVNNQTVYKTANDYMNQNFTTGTTPSPADYTVTSDLANSRIYASLKA